MKQALRKLFSPILNPLEAGEPSPHYRASHRTVLNVVGLLFLVLASVSLGALVYTGEPGALIPILVVFGAKWTGMAPIVSGLALVMPLMAVQIICSPTVTATGKERIYLATSMAGAAIFATSFLIGVQFGAQGLVRAWWVAAPLLLAITLALTLPQIRLPLRRLLLAALPPAAACLAMAGVVAALRLVLPADIGPVATLAILGLAGAATYCGILFLAWPDVVRQSLAMLRRTPSDPLPLPASGPAPARHHRPRAPARSGQSSLPA